VVTRFVAVPEAEPAECRGLVFTATERPDGSWKSPGVQSETQPCSAASDDLVDIEPRDGGTFDLTK